MTPEQLARLPELLAKAAKKYEREKQPLAESRLRAIREQAEVEVHLAPPSRSQVSADELLTDIPTLTEAEAEHNRVLGIIQQIFPARRR